MKIGPWHRWIVMTLAGGLLLGSLGPGDRALAQADVDTAPETDTETTEPARDMPQTEAPVDGEPDAEIARDARFTCEVQNGQPTVMYAPRSRPGERYAWATPEAMGSAWPAQRRCEEISRRLEDYRPDGLLELKTGLENGYNTVCVTTEDNSACRIVFTVPQGQDPALTRDRVFDNLAMADQGQTTRGISTLVQGGSIWDGLDDLLGFPNSESSTNSAVNLRPFLDPADGGTGLRLNPASSRPLDADNF